MRDSSSVVALHSARDQLVSSSSTRRRSAKHIVTPVMLCGIKPTRAKLMVLPQKGSRRNARPRAPRCVTRSVQVEQQGGESGDAAAQGDNGSSQTLPKSPTDERLAKALSYREQRRQEDSDMIKQAASRKDKSVEGVRPEMETYLRENREMEVEILSVNKEYKPKVSTWGVFPRPDNISKAYGGGRNLAPGAVLETPEQAQARVDRVKNAVGAYRKMIGFDVDVENQEEVAKELRVGIDLLEAGRLEAAAAKLRAVTELAPLMSEEGGQARLQLAVCLDSLNMADEAKRLYQSLNRHPNIDIQKRANRMLWGMTTAAEFLKADKINYNTGIREAYARYLTSMTGAWGLYTRENEEEEKQLQILSAVAIVTLVAFPSALFFALKNYSAAAGGH